jgi:uncharacterized protein (DUF2062 family)
MVFKRIHLLLQRMVASERCPSKLAFTCALGIYIGISPLVGLHTAMVFVFGWMFALSIPVLFTVSVMIHNPWTMMPVYAIDHIFGKWLFAILKIDCLKWDPAWVETCNLFLREQTGVSGLSLTAFLVGGNLLGVIMSVMLYPLMKRIFTRYLFSAPHSNPNSTITSLGIQGKTSKIGVRALMKSSKIVYENNSPK